MVNNNFPLKFSSPTVLFVWYFWLFNSNMFKKSIMRWWKNFFLAVTMASKYMPVTIHFFYFVIIQIMQSKKWYSCIILMYPLNIRESASFGIIITKNICTFIWLWETKKVSLCSYLIFFKSFKCNCSRVIYLQLMKIG